MISCWKGRRKGVFRFINGTVFGKCQKNGCKECGFFSSFSEQFCYQNRFSNSREFWHMQFLSYLCLCMRGALHSASWGVLCMTRWGPAQHPWSTPSLPHQTTSHHDSSYCTEKAALHEEISEHARYMHFSVVLPRWATLSKLVACCGQEMQSLLEPSRALSGNLHGHSSIA